MKAAVFRLLGLIGLLLWLQPAWAVSQVAMVQLAEYIGADYINAVENGEIINDDEFEEMTEFAELLLEGVGQLPDAEGRAELETLTVTLHQAIEAKATNADIKRLTARLRAGLIDIYGVAVAPSTAPDLTRAATVYQQTCALCHGTEGHGDGPAGANLDPEPTDFHELERFQGRSLVGLYTTITDGVDGTGMAAYAELLSEDERWALAFYVGSLAVTEQMRADGAHALQNLPALDQQLDLNTVISLAPEDVIERWGEPAYAAAALLRADPQRLFASNRFIALSQQRLADAERLYRAGDQAAARSAALSAYLDGYEMIEQQVSTLDSGLMQRAERAFMGVRESIDRDLGSDAVSGAIQHARALLREAADLLDGDGLTASAAATASFVILFREGLEALLVVAALITFTRRSQVQRATRFIHLGWIGAVLAGFATWFVASTVITISGSTREVTEGLAGLIAAAILFYMGFWMHSNAKSQQWMGYLRDKVDSALGRSALWTLAFVAFISVYREMFETILFYQALWTQVGPGERMSIFYGMIAALVALAVVALLIFRLGMKLPLALFFRVTSVVLLVLAFVLLGKGVAALQEAGWLSVRYLDVPSISWLGIYPTLQGLLAQGAYLVLAVVMWLLGNRAARQPG